MSTITIPAPLVPDAFEAALYLLGRAGDNIMGEAERRHPDVGAALARFDAARGLLDAIGRDRSDTAIQINEAHRPELLEALREHITAQVGIVKTAHGEGHVDVAREQAANLADLTALAAVLSEKVPA